MFVVSNPIFYSFPFFFCYDVLTFFIFEANFTGYISYPRTETNMFAKDMNLNIYVQQQTVSGEWGEFAQEVSSANCLTFQNPLLYV